MSSESAVHHSFGTVAMSLFVDDETPVITFCFENFKKEQAPLRGASG